MNDNGGNSDALKEWIAKGVTRPKTQYIYINANLAIFRVILPYMVSSNQNKGYYSNLYKTNPKEFDKQMARIYKDFVKAEVFAKAKIKNAELYHQTTNSEVAAPPEISHPIVSHSWEYPTAEPSGNSDRGLDADKWWRRMASIELQRYSEKFLAYVRF